MACTAADRRSGARTLAAQPAREFLLAAGRFPAERSRETDFGFTIFRPQIIFGDAIGAAMNIIPVLGAGAAIRREERLPSPIRRRGLYAGGRRRAGCLARAFRWAAHAPSAHDETFNLTNGDVFVWRNVWPAIARALGAETASQNPCGSPTIFSRARTSGATSPRSTGWSNPILKAARPLRRIRRLLHGLARSTRAAGAGQHDQAPAGGLWRLHRHRGHVRRNLRAMRRQEACRRQALSEGSRGLRVLSSAAPR